MPALLPSEVSDSVIERKCARVLELREFNRETWWERLRIKHIMDGGVEAVVALLGSRVSDPEMRLPVANLMLSANTRLAQKLGRPPDVKVDPPYDTDSENALKAAERRARIVTGLDELSDLAMMLPQIGRWLPGYGYTVVGLKQVRAPNGDPFAGMELKDPFECIDTETEVLTKRGWLRHDELTTEDTVAGYDLDLGMARWTACHAVNRYEHDGEIVAVDKRDLSMRLTPDHRCVVQKVSGPDHHRGPVHIERAEHLTTRHFIPRSAEWVAHGEKSIGLPLASLLGWVAAEGCYHDGDRVYLLQSLSANPRHVETIDRLLADCPEFPADTSSRKKLRQAVLDGRRTVRTTTSTGVVEGNVESTMVTWVLPLGLGQEVRRLMPEKTLGMWMLDLPESERQAVLDSFVDGDGHRFRDGSRVTAVQRERRNLDVLQALAVTLGYKASVRRKKDGMYVLYVMSGRSTSLRHRNGASESAPLRRERYTGIVWCPTTGTGTFFARRDGYVFITGNCLIGEWGPQQQPPDYATIRTTTVDALLRMPYLSGDARSKLEHRKKSGGSFYGSAVMLDDKRGWANQGGAGIEVYEYTDDEGCWWVVPEEKILLNYLPNLLSRPPFWAFKRFSFSRLTGQYDHVIGLMAAMARLNLLAIIGTEDSVLSETNVVGDTEAATYRKGRDAVNYFAPGTKVQKMHDTVNPLAFTQLDRLERQLRIVAGYPVTDDAQHPGGGWATGRGLQELTAVVNEEVREYHTILATGLSKLDALRLEAEETWYPDTAKTMEGAYRGAAFVDTYVPSKHIKGNRRTRRIYGAMAGWDDATKIVGGLQLLQAGIIDDDTFRENLDGLENPERIKKRNLAMKAEALLFDSLAGLAQQGDPTALEAAVEMLPEGSVRSTMEAVLLRRQEQQAEAEMAPETVPGEPPPDVATVLSRLTGSGEAQGGAQTVARVA